MIDTESSIQRMKENPQTIRFLLNIDDGDKFVIDEDESTLTVVTTPGHQEDHVCFYFEQKNDENVMFVGDHILGSPQVVSNNLVDYMQSLYKLRKFTDCDKYALSHSIELTREEVLIPALPKLEAYIQFREDRENQMKKTIEEKMGKYFTKHEIYNA